MTEMSGNKEGAESQSEYPQTSEDCSCSWNSDDYFSSSSNESLGKMPTKPPGKIDNSSGGSAEISTPKWTGKSTVSQSTSKPFDANTNIGAKVVCYGMKSVVHVVRQIKTEKRSVEPEEPTSPVPGPSRQSPRSQAHVKQLHGELKVKDTGHGNVVATRIGDSFSGVEHFVFRSETPKKQNLSQLPTERRFTKHLGAKLFDIQKNRFASYMETPVLQPAHFTEGDEVVFYSMHSCYQKAKFVKVADKPVSVGSVPKKLREEFPDYKKHIIMCTLSLVGCSSGEDENHMKEVAIYDVYPFFPKTADDMAMLLLAHHWNDTVIFRIPEAHYKARYISFFTLTPDEYVALDDLWRKTTKQTKNFIDSFE